MRFIGTPKFLAIPVKMGFGIKVVDNKIRLSNVQVLPNTPGRNMGPISDFMERITLAVFDLDNIGGKDTHITIKKINVKNDKIDIEGNVRMAAK
ncbi:MAG: hypothetical protein MZU97_10915 [Bacillus subtilis]|nr:hypothetical protein [Bacillus subtilis]